VNVEQYLAERRALVEAALERALLPVDGVPPRLQEAMRYAVFSGGKRVRPVLSLMACEAAGGAPERALPFACALELIHTYSWVHDDLPAMDDDDLRGGRPTVHIAFDEALAAQPPAVWGDEQNDQVHPGLAGHAVIARCFLRAVGYGDI